jgi:hypothetical protein
LNGVLKITSQETDQLVSMKLEGRIAGPWVAELDRTWRSLAPALKSRRLVVDLRDVSYVEPEGRRVLAEIYGKTGAEFRTRSLLIEFYAREATNGRSTNGKAGTK